MVCYRLSVVWRVRVRSMFGILGDDSSDSVPKYVSKVSFIYPNRNSHDRSGIGSSHRYQVDNGFVAQPTSQGPHTNLVKPSKSHLQQSPRQLRDRPSLLFCLSGLDQTPKLLSLVLAVVVKVSIGSPMVRSVSCPRQFGPSDWSCVFRTGDCVSGSELVVRSIIRSM
jgi:hypothetical protein